MNIQRFAALPLLLFAISIDTFAQSESNMVQPTPQPARLIVVNKGDANIAIIDPVAGRVLAVVPVNGITAHEVAVSPDGRTAFVPIYGNAGVATAGTDGANMVVIDIPSAKIIGNVDFGHGVRPHFPVYDKASGLLYVTTEIDHTVTIIDPKTLKIIGTIPTTQAQSHVLAVSHDGRRGYTANVGPGTLSVLDMHARKLITVIPISANTQRVSISMDDKLVFTADQTRPQLAVVDTATNKLKTWVPLPAVGYGTVPTPDGHWLLVALPSTNQVAAVDLTTLTVAHTIDVAKLPQALTVQPDSKRAYASCIGSQKVAVIDLSTWKVTFIEAGKGVDGLAWAN